jgi:hypothetical protein
MNELKGYRVNGSQNNILSSLAAISKANLFLIYRKPNYSNMGLSLDSL